MKTEKDRRARRRALRAAQVVTLGLALAGGGCYADHEREAPSAVVVEDASVDAGAFDAGPPDAGPPDAGPADAGALADAGCTTPDDWVECCNELGWPCDESRGWGCCAWGPYVPPGDELPPSRAA